MIDDPKLTNPKQFLGADKIPFHLWPEVASALGSLALEHGALKYGRGNFRPAGVQASIYYDACRRHLNAWFEGEWLDRESGVPHIAHALACLAIIAEAHYNGNLTDDRPYPGGYFKAVDDLTPLVKKLKDGFGDRTPKHWTIKDAQPAACGATLIGGGQFGVCSKAKGHAEPCFGQDAGDRDTLRDKAPVEDLRLLYNRFPGGTKE